MYVHGIVGFIVTSLGISQPLNALLRPDKDSTMRSLWELMHKNCGRVATLLGVFNCIIGALLAKKQHDGEFAFNIFLVASILICPVFVVAYIIGRLRSHS